MRLTVPSDPTGTPVRNIYDQWVFDTFGVDPSTYPPLKPSSPHSDQVDADVAAIQQGTEASRERGHVHGVQIAQLAVPGVPLPLPISPDALPAPLPPSVERDLGHVLDRASRRLEHIGKEVAHGDLADAAGHALLGHPFPPEVDDPGLVPPLPMPPVPGTTPLSDEDRRLAGAPETFPAGRDAAPGQEGFTAPSAHIPDTTAHPAPTPAIPTVVAASNPDKDAKPIPGFTETESAAIAETEAALRSDGFKALKKAFQTGTEAAIVIDGRTIFYVPDLPPGYSGMTMTADQGFVMGPDAMASPEEAAKTFLQEIYRLRSAQNASGAAGSDIAAQTRSAHDFADRAYGVLKP